MSKENSFFKKYSLEIKCIGILAIALIVFSLMLGDSSPLMNIVPLDKVETKQVEQVDDISPDIPEDSNSSNEDEQLKEDHENEQSVEDEVTHNREEELSLTEKEKVHVALSQRLNEFIGYLDTGDYEQALELIHPAFREKAYTMETFKKDFKLPDDHDASITLLNYFKDDNFYICKSEMVMFKPEPGKKTKFIPSYHTYTLVAIMDSYYIIPYNILDNPELAKELRQTSYNTENNVE